MPLKQIKVGLLGLGTVGCSVINVLQRNKKDIANRIGQDIVVIKAAANTLDKQRSCETETIELTTDASLVVSDPNIDIIIEVIGGIEPAKSLILEAINQGKPVITANKALIALHGNEIFEAARAKGVAVMFEAAVAGGIPIIKALREGLSGNRIEWLAGIINGTSNYILSQMDDTGCEFNDALVQATALGYAEADPTFDIEGIDAAHKLAILASIAFGIPLQFDKVYVEGIKDITRYDVKVGQELGYVLKHFAIAERVQGSDGVVLKVHPVMIKKDHLLAQVNSVMNAIYIMTDFVGPTLHYGAGAGGNATASAVVADLLDVTRTLDTQASQRVPYLGFVHETSSETMVCGIEQASSRFYLRIPVMDKLGTLAKLTEILAASKISIDTILQRREDLKDNIVPIVILTHPTLEQQMDQAINEMSQLSVIQGSIAKIRIDHFSSEKG